jgi:hypothetical protein
MTKTLVAAALIAMALPACDTSDGTPGGDGPGGGTPSQPISHLLANDTPGTIQPNQYQDFAFQVPASATVAYQIADRSSTDPDNFTAGILPESEVGYFMNKQKYQAFAAMKSKAPLSGAALVPPGSYHFVALCENAIESCQFSFTVTALY